jgi:hypothetical protein
VRQAQCASLKFQLLFLLGFVELPSTLHLFFASRFRRALQLLIFFSSLDAGSLDSSKKYAQHQLINDGVLCPAWAYCLIIPIIRQ